MSKPIIDKVPPTEDEVRSARQRISSKERPQVVDKRRFLGSDVESGDGAVLLPDYLGQTGKRLQFSPSSDPNKPSTMDCGTALRLAGEGKRVTRLAWDNPETFLLMFMWGAINPEVPAGKYLSIHHANGNVHPLYLNDGDLLGDDWVLV